MSPPAAHVVAEGLANVKKKILTSGRMPCEKGTRALSKSKAQEKTALFVTALSSFMGPFVISSVNVALPAIQKEFVASRLFASSCLAAPIHDAATFALAFLLSLYLQYIKGLGPRTTGIILVAQPLVMAVCSPLRTMTTIACIVATLVMIGFRFALFSSPNMNAIMGAVDKRFFGIASGAVAAMRLLGQMASMTVAMVVFSVFMGRHPIAPAHYESFLGSVRISFKIFFVLCVAGTVFSPARGSLRHGWLDSGPQRWSHAGISCGGDLSLMVNPQADICSEKGMTGPEAMR